MFRYLPQGCNVLGYCLTRPLLPIIELVPHDNWRRLRVKVRLHTFH